MAPEPRLSGRVGVLFVTKVREALLVALARNPTLGPQFPQGGASLLSGSLLWSMCNMDSSDHSVQPGVSDG